MDNGEIYQSAVRVMQAKKDSITMLVGPPGTGKTRSAIEAALNKNLQIVIVRPPVPFGKTYGLLPGELDNKISPWVENIKNILSELDVFPDKAIEEGDVIFASFEHLQGDTFHKSFIIIDEAENCTLQELYVVMTRIGRDSRMAICGDVNQMSSHQKNSGFAQLRDMMTGFKSMNVVDFEDAKCYRSGLCADVTTMFRVNNCFEK